MPFSACSEVGASAALLDVMAHTANSALFFIILAGLRPQAVIAIDSDIYLGIFRYLFKRLESCVMSNIVFAKACGLLVTMLACGLTQAAEITVSAASSLTNAFKDIAQRYESQYPGAKVALNFGASGALLQQIARGAPVDVLATADQETMDQAQQRQLLDAADRHDFVRNRLVLIAPRDSQLQFRQLSDLMQPGVQRVAIGLPASVPAGRYAKQALEVAKLWVGVQAKMVGTQNVRQSLDYVARDEVEAGFVYATDALLLKDKVKVVLDVPLGEAIRYPIARLGHAPNGAEAQRFIAYVRSPAGQAVLAQYGFQKP